MCSPGSFIVLALTFRCMIHFELTFGMVWGRGSYALFCMWISSCPSTVCRKDYSFPMEMPPNFVENQLTLYCWTFHFTHDLFVCPYGNIIMLWFSHRFYLFLRPHLLFWWVYFWLCWFFVAAQGLSLIVVSGGHFLFGCAHVSLCWEWACSSS